MAKLIKENFPVSEKYILSSQLLRAINSSILNVAEGADRKSDNDFARFLNLSHTSLNEVVSCLDIAYDNGYITQEVLHKHLLKAEKIANQLTAFHKKLFESK